MKKHLIVLLVFILILCAGCGKQAPEQTEATTPETTAPSENAVSETTLPPETTEETVPVPEVFYGTAKVNKTPAVLSILKRGDVVDVVGEYDDSHYVIKTELGYGLVKKHLLRGEAEAAYETWTAYAYYNAELYDNLNLAGEPVQKLHQNAKVQILDDLGYCYVVQVEDVPGFMMKTRVAKWPFSSGGGDSSSGGGSTSGDGGDISLQYHGGITLLSAIEQKGEVSGQGTILADGTEVILGYFDRGDDIPVVAEEGFADNWEGYHTVYLDGLYAYVPQDLVQNPDEEAYEAWDGYSRWNGVIYDNFQLLGEPTDKLYTKVQVRVIGELENCYIVEFNGVTGYMAKDLVSQTRISTGGGGSDSSSGGGGGGGDWTPPAM